MYKARITSDILSSTQQRINLIIIWYQLFLKLIQFKIFTLCQILGIGIRQKWPQILGTRQNLVLGSDLVPISLLADYTNTACSRLLKQQIPIMRTIICKKDSDDLF